MEVANEIPRQEKTFEAVMDTVPLVCPDRLPPRVSHALYLKRQGLDGKDFEEAMARFDQRGKFNSG